jgi:hypothetical protein
VKTGLRGVSDPDSIGYYKNLTDEKREFERKIRTVLRGITVFMRSLPLLNPFRFGLFSLQLFSHKLCRWCVPFAMVLAGVSNVALALHGVFYQIALILQLVFYTVAVGGMYSAALAQKQVFRLPTFFVLVNLAVLRAWHLYVQGERLVCWAPSRR